MTQIAVTAGAALPYDRVWAVAHEAAKLDGGNWVSCNNFSRGAKTPGLMAMTAQYDEGSGQMMLQQPDLGEISFDPDNSDDAARFIDWVSPLTPKNRATPTRLIRADAQAMTDSDFPSIAILGLPSLAALSNLAGRRLDTTRFRGNFWVDGTAPFEEFDWVGRRLRVGQVELEVRERITRCVATTVNPDSGKPDIDTLALLEEQWGHQDLGVYAVAETSGIVRQGDDVEILKAVI